MDEQHVNDLNDIYDLFVKKIEGKFDVSSGSVSYEKLAGELTIRINESELHVGFGRDVSVVINFWTKKQELIPIEYDDGGWSVPPYSDWNKSNSAQKFDEIYLDKIIRHFEAISKV